MKTLANLECEACGKSDHWFFDASVIRERDFEGVYFEIREVNGEIVVSGRAEDEEYLEDFNTKKLFKEAASFVENDELSTIVCPTCEEPLA